MNIHNHQEGIPSTVNSGLIQKAASITTEQHALQSNLKKKKNSQAGAEIPENRENID